MKTWGGPREDGMLFLKKNSPQKVMQMAGQPDCGCDMYHSRMPARCLAL